MSSCSSMPISWVGSAGRRKLFLGEKLATTTCLCPRSVGKGQVLGKTLHAVMNWKYPKPPFMFKTLSFEQSIHCRMQERVNSYHSGIG